MPTFVLKKYDQPTGEVQEDNIEKKEGEEGTENAEGTDDKGKETGLTVKITGSISEILANALNKAFANKNIEMSEIQDDDEEGKIEETEQKVDVKTISTEEIKKDPLMMLRSISSENVVLIDSKMKPFRTFNEEYFLTNVGDRSEAVFTTANQFADHISKLMK